MLHGTIDIDFVQLSFQALPQPITQSTHALRFFRHFLLSQFARLAESDDAGDIERSGPHAALVPAPVDAGGKLHARIAPTHVQGAYALGPINLVPGNRQEINVVLLNVHRDFADRLYAIHRKDDAVLFGDFADFRHRIDHADFVVGVHDGD